MQIVFTSYKIELPLYFFIVSPMDEQKEPLSINNGPNMLSCPRCSFPIRSEDDTCMYCNEPLRPTGWRLYYFYCRRYFQQLQWRRRVKNRAGRRKQLPKSNQYIKYFALLGVGVVLTLIGGYMLVNSVLSNDFSQGVISLLFLFYGIYTLKTLLVRR